MSPKVPISNFNPLPPCGGRHFQICGNPDCDHISIHSLRVEGDYAFIRLFISGLYFNPLPPCGGRRFVLKDVCKVLDFNPLPPCGGRLATVSGDKVSISFQSTPSVWRETDVASDSFPNFKISIHSLRVEGDYTIPEQGIQQKDFNPLPPCGGRRLWFVRPENHGDFNPLPPCGGRLKYRII